MTNNARPQTARCHKPVDASVTMSYSLGPKKHGKGDSLSSLDNCKLPTKTPEIMSQLQRVRRDGNKNVNSKYKSAQLHEDAPTEVRSHHDSVASANPLRIMETVDTGNITVNHQYIGRAVTEQINQNHTTVDSPTDAALSEIIELQFGLEILLKHRELRLIDQEIAKCQVSLEQLRRCQLIPFPAITSASSDMQAVSSGIGPVYSHESGNEAQQPAAWGVTDGPYSHHYARWLLQDKTFDGQPPDDIEPRRPAGKMMPDRATRGSKADNVAGAISRSQRGSAGLTRLQALPSGYTEPKEEKGPMIVKRSTDGRMVKLVCLDCRRQNFNSAQGFINHCRIAHGRNFQTHDAAAISCGEEAEPNDAGGLNTDVCTGSVAYTGLVHPLIRSAKLPENGTAPPTAKRRKLTSDISTTVRMAQNGTARPGISDRSMSGTSSTRGDKFSDIPFVPALQTPHLSGLFKKYGRGGNLNEIVSDATERITVEVDFPTDNESVAEAEVKETAKNDISHHLSARIGSSGRLSARATMSPAPLDRPPSSKGLNSTSRKSGYLNNLITPTVYSSPYARTTSIPDPNRRKDTATEPNLSGQLSPSIPFNHSPNTVESNPAPSLVSDDEDDYEDQHSVSDAPTSEIVHEGDDRYLDIEVEDGDVGRPNADPELTTAAKVETHPTRRRSVQRTSETSCPDARQGAFQVARGKEKRGRKTSG